MSGVTHAPFLDSSDWNISTCFSVMKSTATTDSSTDLIQGTTFLYTCFTFHEPVSGEFLAQKPVTRSFDVFFDLRLE